MGEITKSTPRSMVDGVEARIAALIDNGRLVVPEEYSPSTALQSAWLLLQGIRTKDGKPVLSACTKESIANSMLDMVLQGLDPARTQCYFIAYGTTLSCQRSYFGDEALLRRLYPGAEVRAAVIYLDDKVKVEVIDGMSLVTNHEIDWASMQKMAVAGAYAEVHLPERGIVASVVMPIDRIHRSWLKSKTYDPSGKRSSPHSEFPDEMAKRTVIRAVCKRLINAAPDTHLAAVAARQQDMLSAHAQIEEDRLLNANKEVLDLPPMEEDEATVAAESDAPQEEPQGEDQTQEAAPGPRERFRQLVEERQLDPTRAKRAAAELAGVQDPLRMTDAQLEQALADPDKIVAAAS